MSPVRARARITRSGVRRPNHEATAPPLRTRGSYISYLMRFTKYSTISFPSRGRSELQTCVRKHVDGCVKDDSILKDMAGQITDLMLLYAYNCGDEKVDTSNIGSFLWLITKCVPERLKKAYECWRDFHSVFSQSRNNVSNACG